MPKVFFDISHHGYQEAKPISNPYPYLTSAGDTVVSTFVEGSSCYCKLGPSLSAGYGLLLRVCVPRPNLCRSADSATGLDCKTRRGINSAEKYYGYRNGVSTSV